MEAELSDAVTAAAAREDVYRAVNEVYASLALEIEIRQPVCKTSGRCCRFEEFGHRLYVTTLELAKFTKDLSLNRRSPPLAVAAASKLTLPVLPAGTQGETDWNGLGCPFQSQGMCGVHLIRPFGCRIFFCDETSTQWQHEQYERHHGTLRKLHDELNVPYFYVEWRFALKTLNLIPTRSRVPQAQ